MQDYIGTTPKMIDLHSIAEEMEDFNVVALLLSGLPDDYSALITVLDAHADDDVVRLRKIL